MGQGRPGQVDNSAVALTFRHWPIALQEKIGSDPIQLGFQAAPTMLSSMKDPAGLPLNILKRRRLGDSFLVQFTILLGDYQHNS